MGLAPRTPRVLVASAREHPVAVALEERGYMLLRARTGAAASLIHRSVDVERLQTFCFQVEPQEVRQTSIDASCLLGHGENVVAGHLSDELRMCLVDVLLDLLDELVVVRCADDLAALAVDDLGHRAPFG